MPPLNPLVPAAEKPERTPPLRLQILNRNRRNEMLQSRTPITDANIAAHEATVAARIASGELDREAIYGKPYSGAVIRDIVGEMADYITESGSGTKEDLLLKFSEQQIKDHLQAARDRANRNFVRRAA
jgi:hypothetical protein